jgi:hypothetical protein
MKYIVFLQAILLLQLVPIDDPIGADHDKIDEIVESIDKNLSKLDSTKIEIWDESTEGGEATIYYKSNDTSKIRAILFNETSRLDVYYYYANNDLIFVKVFNLEYNRPIGWDEKMAEEMGDDEVFEHDKTIIFKYSFYYVENVCFRKIIDSKDKQIKFCNSLGSRIKSLEHKVKNQTK